VLRALTAAGFPVAVVVTRPDRRRGRGGPATPSAAKAAAVDLGVEVAEHPSAAVEAGADLGVVVAYGALIRRPVLEAVPMVNVHFSLLPRWRGAAPVERAILAGDDVTGVSLMALEEGLDTGPVYRRQAVAIGPRATARELRGRLAALGAALLVEELEAGLGTPLPQEGDPTYAAKVTPGELRLDWHQPAAALDRVVRAGRAWTTWRGRRLLVLEVDLAPGVAGEPGALRGRSVATGDGALELVTVQPEGRAAVTAVDWLRGARPRPGDRLGS
jgi:methionyl-tRNA formyltransferase